VALFVGSATGFRDTFTLPVTGTYTIVVNPRVDEVGGLTFALGAVPANTGATAIGTPTTVTTTTIGENPVRSFAATAGQQVTLTVTGNSMIDEGVDLTVFNPSGGSVAALFVGSASGFRTAFTLAVTGTYTIVVNPRADEVGGLTFTLNQVAPP
jgi:hypothetical protein